MPGRGSSAVSKPEREVAAEAVLSCLDVVKNYSSGSSAHQALRGVTFSVGPHAFLSVMGSSGSGKSTMLNLLGGLDTPSAGEVLLRGRSIAEMDDGERAETRRHDLGFVFQAFNLVAVLSARENVALPGVIAGWQTKRCHQRADELLALVGLEPCGDRLPSELSGGQQQRLAIARALFMTPAVVLADEPTGNLDSDSSDEVLAILRHANRELGQAIVIVTHEARVAAAAEDVVLLEDGLIVDTLHLDRDVSFEGDAREAAVMSWLKDARLKTRAIASR